MENSFKLTETTRRILDAMAEMDIDTIYDKESGDYIFSYKAIEMVVLASEDEGGVCLSAEFIMDKYMDTIAELWVDVLNKNGGGFVLSEPFPGVGRISKEWLMDWEKPLPTEELENMLEVMAGACRTISHNLMEMCIPEEDVVEINGMSELQSK